MSLRTFKIGALVTCVAAFLVTMLAFAFVDEVGSAYVLAMKSGGARVLPRLTEDVAIPLLRVRPGDPHERPVTAAWVAVVWLLVLAVPVATAFLSVRARTLESSIAAFSLGAAIHGLLVLSYALLVAIGLAAPLACM